MAALLQRSGTYYAQFYDPAREPTRKRLSLKTGRKRRAQKLLIELEEDFEDGLFDPWTDDPFSYQESDQPETINLTTALQRFLQAKQAQDRSPETLRTYKGIIERFIDAEGDRELQSLDKSTVERWIRTPDLSSATQRKRYTHLRAWFNWLVKQGFLSLSPTDSIDTPRKNEKMPKAIREEELTRLTEAIRADYRDKRQRNCTQEGQIIWKIPALWTALYTGLRASEIARLKWKDVDFERDLIAIRKQKNKREQTIPLIEKAAQVLKAIDGKRSGYVFTAPSDNGESRDIKNWARRLSETFREGRKLAGLGEELSLHSTRHGFCTLLAEAGKSAYVIKDAARHSDISTSMRYVHMANEHLKSELEDVF